MLVQVVDATFLIPPVRPPFVLSASLQGCCARELQGTTTFHRPPHPLLNGSLYEAKWVQLPKPGSVQSASNGASVEEERLEMNSR